ncbi:MAG: hypothetical protein HON70_36880, partial [Lentisphaerae bacterium]|nr:hypothetical protein [Lentisphaerota bacterium]
TATIQGLGVALTLDMPRNFLEADVDGEGSQAGQHDAATIPVAPLVSAQAEAAGLPIDPATPQVSSTQLLVDGAALPGTANPYATSAGTVQFLVTFSEAVQGVDADDFGLRLTKNFVNTSPWPFEEYAAKPDTPLPSAVITAVAPTDGAGTPTASPSATWTVTVSMGNGDGYVRLDVIDNDTIMDVANAEELGGMGAHNGDFFYSEFAYRFDNHGPVIVSASLAADNTYVDLTWNEPVGSTDSLAKTSSFSDLVPQYRWFNTNGAGGQQAGDALWLDRGVAQDNDFFRREDVVLMEPPFTTGLLDGTDRTGEFKNLQANVPVLGATTVAHVCYIELDGELGCSAGDGLFLDVGEVVGLGINFDETFTPGSDMWFWPSGAEPSVATLGAQVPDRTSYYAENAAIPVPDVDDLEAEFQTWVTGFLAGNNNGIWLDYSPADSIYTVGDITDGFVDEMVTGTEPADGQVGASAMPATAMYRDANSNGLLDGADLIWLDDGSTANAYDSGDTRLDDNGDPLPGVLNANALRVLLTKNGGTVTSVGISSITDVAGDALTEGASVTRCHLNYTPDLDLAGGAAPTYLNEYRVPAGVETIEIVPVEENVFDSLGNPADTQTTSGEMRLHDSSIPRVVDIILADDNYSAKVVFSERVYTNGNGISNHNPESVGDNVGDLTVDDFTAATNTNAININNISYSLANNYCILYFGNNAASRALVDPAATGATTLTVSIAAGDIFDFGGNAVPATDWDVTLRAPYDIDDPDSMPPRYFTTGDGAYLRYGTAPVETNTDTDAEGLTYNGIFYRDLDGDCRVDAVDLNFRNPYPNQTYTPALSTGGTFRVWVQNNDPEDTSNAPEDENLANVSDTNFTGGLPSRASSDWSEITVQSMSVYRVTTYYSTIRVLINQSQVRARTHGKRWVMISYNDSTDGTDGLPPASGETDTRERDGVHWYRQIVQNPDVADYYYVVGDFPPTMAWDGAPARPISAAMWRTTNYNKSGESSSYNSYDYLDIVFSEPLSSVGNTGWTPGASYGAGSSVHQKEGPYGPEIIDLLSGTAQTVRLWFNSTSVTSRTIGGGGNTSSAQVVDAAGNRNSTPHFTGTAIGVRNLDARYGVLGFSHDDSWTDLLAVDAESAEIEQYSSDSNSSAQFTHSLSANRVTLRGFDQGGFNPNSDAYWRQSNTGGEYLLAGSLNQSLSNANASITFSAAANNSNVTPGDGLLAGIGELRIYNSNLVSNSHVPGTVANGIFAMTPPVVIESGPVYAMVKVSPVTYSSTSRLDERERSVLGIDAAGRATDVIDGITLRFVDTSYGQFDPERDLLPLADDATSGVRLYKLFGTTGLVQLAAGGLEWGPWLTNAAGQAYREVVLRPLTSQAVPLDDAAGNDGFEYDIRVVTNVSFNLGDSFYVEVPNDGILFRRGRSGADFAAGWDTADGTPGLTFTGHVYVDSNSDGRWGMGETMMDIEDHWWPVPFYDANVPYQHRTQGEPMLSAIGSYQRNLHYAKRGHAPNPNTDPEPPGAANDNGTDLDYNVAYSPGDDVWYDIGGTLGVYDAGVDIPVISNSDEFRCAWSPHEEGCRSVQVRGAAPASVSSALPAGTIAAGSEPTAVLGFDMHDSGRGFAPRFPFGQTGGVVLEAVSKNLQGGLYSDKLVYARSAKTLRWNDGNVVAVGAGGRFILEGASGSFLVVAVTAASLPIANASVDVTISADVDRDIQQPAAIRGVRVHGVGPGNVAGNTGRLSLNGTQLTWQSDDGDGGTAGDPVDVAEGGLFVLSAERVSEADYLVIQVHDVHGATSEDLAHYPADGRVVSPLFAITGLEIMGVSDVVEQGNHLFSYDGISSLSWCDGSPTNVAVASDTLVLVPGNADGTSFVVVRRTSEALPAEPASDILFVNQSRLLRVAVTVNDITSFTSTHLLPLTADQDSGIALYRDANANGVFDGADVDEFVPLIETPIFGGSGSYTTTLYPDPTSRAAHLPNSHVSPHGGNDFFLAAQTSNDMSFGDRFSVSASAYEPTEPNTNGSPAFASGASGTITCTSVTNTVYRDETTSPWTIDAGRTGVSAPTVLFGIDHFLGVPGTVYLQGLTFTLHDVNGFAPTDDLMAMNDLTHTLRGVMLYADNGNGAFSRTADTVIPCDIVVDYNVGAGTYTITMLPINTGTDTLVPEASDSGLSDHFVCLNFSPELEYADELYCTVEVDGIEYSSGPGNAASRLQTHTLAATIKSNYGDLTTRVQTTLTAGLLVTEIGTSVADGYQDIELFFDPVSNAYYLRWNGQTVPLDMTAVASYTLGTGTNSITVTFDPFA